MQALKLTALVAATQASFLIEMKSTPVSDNTFEATTLVSQDAVKELIEARVAVKNISSVVKSKIAAAKKADDDDDGHPDPRAWDREYALKYMGAKIKEASYVRYNDRMRFQNEMYDDVIAELQKYVEGDAEAAEASEWYLENEDWLFCDVVDGFDDKLRRMMKRLNKKYLKELKRDLEKAEKAGWTDEALLAQFNMDSDYMNVMVEEIGTYWETKQAQMEADIYEEIHEEIAEFYEE